MHSNYYHVEQIEENLYCGWWFNGGLNSEIPLQYFEDMNSALAWANKRNEERVK